MCRRREKCTSSFRKVDYLPLVTPLTGAKKPTSSRSQTSLAEVCNQYHRGTATAHFFLVGRKWRRRVCSYAITFLQNFVSSHYPCVLQEGEGGGHSKMGSHTLVTDVVYALYTYNNYQMYYGTYFCILWPHDSATKSQIAYNFNTRLTCNVPTT